MLSGCCFICSLFFLFLIVCSFAENPSIDISHSREGLRRSDYLSSLFAWLVQILGKKPSATANIPKRVLHELLQKCLLISHLCNPQLVDSALHLAKLMDDRSLSEKVRKLSLIASYNSDNAEDQNCLSTSTNIFQFEESMREASKKLELVKQQLLKNRKSRGINCEPEKSQVWTLAKSWNPCPIGMLPRAVGSSGCLPVLNIIDNEKHGQLSGGLPVLDTIDNEKHNQISEGKENWKLIKHGTKRDATSDLQLLDNSTVKKLRETNEFVESDNELKLRETNEFGESDNELPTDGDKGYIMAGGFPKRVTEEELLAIQSSVMILF